MKKMLLVLSTVLLLNGIAVEAMKSLNSVGKLLKPVSQTHKYIKPIHHQPIRKFHASRQNQGPIMAVSLYWLTKIGCYSGVATAGAAIAAGAVASAVGTGGASVAVPLAVAGGTGVAVGVGIPTACAIGGTKAMAAGVVKMSVGAAITAAPGTIAGAASVAAVGPIGVTIVAPILVGGLAGATEVVPAVSAVAIPAAKLATAALATGSAGTGLGIVAGIEAASCSAFAIGMAFPWF